MSPRANNSDSTLHLLAATQFLSGARASYLSGDYMASASSSCLSGIRSGDAVCAAELAQTSDGQHADAVDLLKRTSLGLPGAGLLESCIAAKNLTQYRTIPITEEMAREMLEKATELYDLARAAVLRAGYPMPPPSTPPPDIS